MQKMFSWSALNGCLVLFPVLSIRPKDQIMVLDQVSLKEPKVFENYVREPLLSWIRN